MSEELFKEVGYTLLEQLFDGRRTVVWRARRTKDNLPVVLKFAKQRVADLRINKQLAAEYNLITSRLQNTNGVIRAVDLLKIEEESVYVLVLEDFGGSSLSNYIPIASIEGFLKFAIKVAAALGEIHQRKIFHRDIKVRQFDSVCLIFKPGNILVTPDFSVVKLTDFGASSIFEFGSAVGK